MKKPQLKLEIVDLESTKMILQRVSKHNHLLTWYNIVKYVDQIDGVEKNPPVFAVLKQLQDEGFLSVENPDDDFPKYSITEAGLNFLADKNVSNGSL
jgi:DNA-binding PadR family transcriptional regulator